MEAHTFHHSGENPFIIFKNPSLRWKEGSDILAQAGGLFIAVVALLPRKLFRKNFCRFRKNFRRIRARS